MRDGCWLTACSLLPRPDLSPSHARTHSHAHTLSQAFIQHTPAIQTTQAILQARTHKWRGGERIGGGEGATQGKRHGRGMGEGKAWRGLGEAWDLLPAHGLSLLAEIAASHHQAILPDETVVGARAPAHGTPSSPPSFPSSPPCRSPPGLQTAHYTHDTLASREANAHQQNPE